MSWIGIAGAVGGGIAVAVVSIVVFCKAAAEQHRYQPPPRRGNL